MGLQSACDHLETKWIVCLFRSYILATSKVKSGQIITSDSAHDDVFIVLPNWKMRSSRLWPQVPTQSHYPYTELTIPCPTLLSVRLGSEKYQFYYKSLGWFGRDSNYCPSPHAGNLCSHAIWPPRPGKLSKWNDLMTLKRLYGPICGLGTLKTNPWWLTRTLLKTLLCCHTAISGHQHYDQMYHSVTLSWYWAKHSLSYSINAKVSG